MDSFSDLRIARKFAQTDRQTQRMQSENLKSGILFRPARKNEAMFPLTYGRLGSNRDVYSNFIFLPILSRHQNI